MNQKKVTELESSKKQKTAGNWLVPSVVLSFTMSFMLCIFEPLQLYFTNIIDVWYDIYNLMPGCLIMLAAMFGGCMVLFAIARLIHEKLWKAGAFIFGITLICTYVQGNYLAGNLPPIDGNLYPWELFDYQRKYCILLWCIVIGISGLAVRKKGLDFVIRVQKWIAGFLLAILVVTNVTTCLMHDGLVDKGDLTTTAKNFYTLSKDGTNFVIVMLDSVRGEELNEVLETDEIYHEQFKDFTCYADAMSGYPMTQYSIYFLLSGDWFDGDEYINDYRTNIFLNCPLFSELEERDYTMDLYMLELPYIDNDGFYRFRNFVRQQSHFSSLWKFAKLELRLVGLKYAPYDLKRMCLALPEEIDNLRAVDDVSDLYDAENPYFVKQLREGTISYQEQNVFKFVQSDGAHAPFYFNTDLEETTQEVGYHNEIRACLNMMHEYIEKYKEAGCYDNTVFVILSDHGYNSEPVGELKDFWNPTDRQHTMLFIKGFNEHHDTLQFSNAPVHHCDLPEAYRRLMDGAQSGDVFDVKEGDYRERRFMLHTSVYSDYFYEYIQTGEAGDMETMKPTGREYESIDGQVAGPPPE
ncbi:MAG: sulfatase-like hydrolase/transferase [Lachnospiraceae bacterium]|nr:sulfatase-like hydrolase/transferase [Lachnospiraceae bacterium]